MADTAVAVEAILSHVGVKGMRWGVRKASSSATTRTTFKKAPSKLSDAELVRRISRMETEKKYNQLNRKDISEGKKIVMDILGTSGRRIGSTVLTGGGLLLIRAALTSKFGEGIAKEATKRLK
jgi:hypothetical protein